jgi:predicted N-acetyltransferase YhbS
VKRFLRAGGAPSDLVLALEGNAIIGFAHTFTPKSVELRGSTHWFPLLGNAWGGLGPIGIAASHRGRGLGLALLAAGLQHLRTQGVEQAIIDWTDLVDFYGRFGFQIWRRYTQGGKPWLPVR